METGHNSLYSLVAARNDWRQTEDDDLRCLERAMHARFGDAVLAVVYYGSCLRGQGVREGLADLYVLVDSGRVALGSRWQAALMHALPPNVYYAQCRAEDGAVLRAKVAVLTLKRFERCCQHSFHSYFWGRFCQPIAVVYARDQAIAARLHTACVAAIVRFLRATRRLCTAPMTPERWWCEGLRATYAAELRVEQPERIRQLYDHDRTHFDALTEAMLAQHIEYGGDVSARARRACQWRWRWRQRWGKVLSVARLLKAFTTFRGGLDYAAWKISRHSGQTVDIPTHVRRWPWVFGWGFFLRLWWRGVLR